MDGIEKIQHLLACPKCRSYNVRISISNLHCYYCSSIYPIINNVPIFISNPLSVKRVEEIHESNQIPQNVIDLIDNTNGLCLNIGAGSTQSKVKNCIELEYSIFRNTDIVADVHQLPFRDEAFDLVISLNTFEHLNNPSIAAKEIERVLKPGGKILIHTAFLQPLHEAPHHYYNATKYGVINWFSDFDITDCKVSDNFSPNYVLSWLSSEILYHYKNYSNEVEFDNLCDSTIQDWSYFWRNPESRKGYLWESLSRLPQSVQEKFSAGFEIIANKPLNKKSQDFIKNLQSQILTFYKRHIDIKQISDERRISAALRYQIAKACELNGNTPWLIFSNEASDNCLKPVISVVVTLFNYSNYITQCLESVCNSDLSDLPGDVEIIVVDDYSTDGSVSIVRDFINKSQTPAKLIKKSYNTGLADARNIGIKVANVPYIFILDADNYLHPDCLVKLFKALCLSECAAAYSVIQRIDNNTNKSIGYLSSSNWSVQELVKRPYIDAMALFRKQILDDVGAYSTELVEYGWYGWEDYDLWLKIAMHNYSIMFVPEVLSYYRVHRASMIYQTTIYEINIANHFYNKFNSLVSLCEDSTLLFGQNRKLLQIDHRSFFFVAYQTLTVRLIHLKIRLASKVNSLKYRVKVAAKKLMQFRR